MVEHAHLRLERLSEPLERRKLNNPGASAPQRDRAEHGIRLNRELDSTVEIVRRRRRPQAIDPSLLLKVHTVAPVAEEDWRRAGLSLVSTSSDDTLLLFSSSDDLEAFRSRLEAYSGDIPEGQKNAPYSGLLNAVEHIGAVEPKDRIGIRLSECGFADPDDFDEDQTFNVDLEFWDIGSRDIREAKLNEVSSYVVDSGGSEHDRYLGPSITILRVSVGGETLRSLLSLEEVASIDYPPAPDLDGATIVQLSGEEVPELQTATDSAPIIGIIDSGVNDHPLLQGALVDAFSEPESLGTADDNGHGTRVAGIAVFGELGANLANSETITQGARICSGKVVNSAGSFDDKSIVPSQMDKVVRKMHDDIGVRIFVISLADDKFYYRSDNRVGSWAATLDELARDLDVLIFVSAGNRKPRSGAELESAVTEYPVYLTEPENRLFEPAGAVNVVTVGSIASDSGLRENEDLFIRSITTGDEPSPFTRVGPGASAISKPDLVDYGGTAVIDTVSLRFSSGKEYPSAGVVSLHHNYGDSYFSAASGTSYSAPLAAFKASQVLKVFPHASANLLRALLSNAARVPDSAIAQLDRLDGYDGRFLCGNGVADLERAAHSDDSRVVLYTEDELEIDQFAVYKVSIPEEFQTTRGFRSVRVTLAFDPPVRHTRQDYCGVRMSYRLVRGRDPDFVFEHFRRRMKDERPFPELENRYNCNFVPGATSRDPCTLQCGVAEFKRDISDYGDEYFLVVRCEGRWATEIVESQRFAVVVELFHEANLDLYHRLRPRSRLTT